MKEYALKESIYMDIINGIEDHAHCLFRLRPVQSPSDVIRKIKGESSHWINEHIVLEHRFAWQKGYGIFSVSEKDIKNVRAYIYNQEKHHRNLDYKQEILQLTHSEYILGIS